MKSMMFATRDFEESVFDTVNKDYDHKISFVSSHLTMNTATLAKGFPSIIVADDKLDAATLKVLKAGGTYLIALRSKGYDNVDLATAKALELRVVRVPSYSPYSVAEHVFALLLALIRHIPASVNRNHNENFTIEGLVGTELHGKTFGIIGTGKIGLATAAIAQGFGCKVVAFDINPPKESHSKISYLPLEKVIQSADVLSLHTPLTAQTHHMIDAEQIAKMKAGAIVINTARGGLIDTSALIEALKSGHLGGACLDVYELGENVFGHDFTSQVLTDDSLARLLTLSNVLLTSHRGFLTQEALNDIAQTTLANLTAFEQQETLVNEVQQLS